MYVWGGVEVRVWGIYVDVCGGMECVGCVGLGCVCVGMMREWGVWGVWVHMWGAVVMCVWGVGVCVDVCREHGVCVVEVWGVFVGMVRVEVYGGYGRE